MGVVGDDRWIHHKEMDAKQLAAKLEHRAARLEQNALELWRRFQPLKLTDFDKLRDGIGIRVPGS